MPGSGDGQSSLVDRRLAAVLEAAALHHTALTLDEVATLLPADAPQSPVDLHRWIASSPHLGRIRDGSVTSSRVEPPPTADVEARRVRGERYWHAARRLFEGTLRPSWGLVQCAGITGSAAYREPAEGDDLDLMAITRRGALWLFLALAFARMRWSRVAPAPLGSHWCLNYVIDERAARKEFSQPSGFLFAREALTTRILQGEMFYRDLLRNAPWMEAELPRLYRRTMSAPTASNPPGNPGSGWALLASVVIFPFLATYLQLGGLYRNYRLRRLGRPEACFRTETRWGRFALLTRKYDRLSEIYSLASLQRPKEVSA